MMDNITDFVTKFFSRALEIIGAEHPIRIWTGFLGGLAAWGILGAWQTSFLTNLGALIACVAGGSFLAMLPLLLTGTYSITEKHRSLFQQAREARRQGNLSELVMNQHFLRVLDDLRDGHKKVQDEHIARLSENHAPQNKIMPHTRDGGSGGSAA